MVAPRYGGELIENLLEPDGTDSMAILNHFLPPPPRLTCSSAGLPNYRLSKKKKSSSVELEYFTAAGQVQGSPISKTHFDIYDPTSGCL